MNSGNLIITLLLVQLWKAITHQPIVLLCYTTPCILKVMSFFLQRTLKQMHWKRTDVITEQIFHALLSTTYVCLFMEVGGIIQATDGKEPDYPYKSYLFKHWLETTIHFKGFSLVFFCAQNFYNLLQILVGLTTSRHFMRWNVQLVSGRSLLYACYYQRARNFLQECHLGKAFTQRDEQGFRWTCPRINYGFCYSQNELFIKKLNMHKKSITKLSNFWVKLLYTSSFSKLFLQRLLFAWRERKDILFYYFFSGYALQRECVQQEYLSKTTEKAFYSDIYWVILCSAFILEYC